MKNIILVIVFLFSSHIIYAQNVGINTDDPKTTLDVNGEIRVRKDIKLGGAAGTAGDSGLDGYAFTSKGSGQSPLWMPITLEPESGFIITQSVVLNDSEGFTDDNKVEISSVTPEYLEDSELSLANGWHELTNLKSEISPTKAKNRLVITLQTVGQSGSFTDVGDLVFGVGIFIDGKLKSVRPLSVLGTSLTFNIGTIFDSFENLSPKANNEPYVIQVGVSLRYRTVGGSGTGYRDFLAVLGTSNTTLTNTNEQMNMTSLKIELFEEIK